jgi:hypothetical protein
LSFHELPSNGIYSINRISTCEMETRKKYNFKIRKDPRVMTKRNRNEKD